MNNFKANGIDLDTIFENRTNWNVANPGDTSLYAWGRNDFGQLGLNDVTQRSSPVQVGAGTNWSLIACGFYHSLGTRTI